jgi:hypothetical protein
VRLELNDKLSLVYKTAGSSTSPSLALRLRSE